MAQLSLFKQSITPKDIVFTPDEVAKDIVGYFQPFGKVLDPCKGDGAFYNALPAGVEKFYCEISEGKDFFNCVEKVEWIIGNPPYSIFLEFLEHSFRLANDIVYLVPTNKIFQSWRLMNLIQKWGGGKNDIGLWKWSFSRFSFWLFSWCIPFSQRMARRNNIAIQNSASII